MRELKAIFTVVLLQANNICVPLGKFSEGCTGKVSGTFHEPKK